MNSGEKLHIIIILCSHFIVVGIGSPNSQSPPREILDQRSPVSPLLEPSPPTFFKEDDFNVDDVEDDNDYDKEYDEDNNDDLPSPGSELTHLFPVY